MTMLNRSPVEGASVQFVGLVRTLRDMCRAASEGRAKDVYGHAADLCAFDGEGRSITSAQAITESDGSTSIGAFFKFPLDPAKYDAPTKPRRFDVLFFGAMRLMDECCTRSTGQGFFFHALAAHIDGRSKFYLRFGDGGRGRGERLYATRIIVDAGGGRAARFAEEHYSYRRRDLFTVAHRTPRLKHPRYGRNQAVYLATELFAENFPEGCGGIVAEDVRALLLELLKAGDAFHGGEINERNTQSFRLPLDGLRPALPGMTTTNTFTIPREFWADVAGMSDWEIDSANLQERVRRAFYRWRNKEDERCYMSVFFIEDRDEGTGRHNSLQVGLFVDPRDSRNCIAFMPPKTFAGWIRHEASMAS